MCRRPFESCPAVVLGVVVWLLAPPALTRAAEPIRLERWAGPARLYINPGPGSDTFRLVAVATWDSSAPRQPGRYAIQLGLPDGSSTTTPLSPREATGASRIDVLVPTAAVLGLRPAEVQVRAAIVDQQTGALASNTLTASIADFPTPASGNPPVDAGPFGWGEPLPSEGAATLPRPGPDGLTFARAPREAIGNSADDDPVVFLSLSEASNRQVADRLEGYEPPAGRSDEFPLEADEQPAFGLTPARAEAYCEALSQADATGIEYRLPTRDEWLSAARAGREAPFWWGDAPAHPEGANFLGPEPALAIDATAPTVPGTAPPTFAANPWGLFHTFGNVAEWASVEESADPSERSYVRLGGHFRTGPEVPLAEPAVPSAEETGDDLFVGVRPALTLSEPQAREWLESVLKEDERLAATEIQVAFDPVRATAVLTGTVPESSDRRRADERLRGIWWLAAVDNQLSTPTLAPGQLAELGQATGPARRSRVLDVILETVPVEVRWADALAVTGSSWYMNVYTSTGGHVAYKLDPSEVGGDRTINVHLDRRALRGLGAGPGDPISLALSLQAPAPSQNGSNIVSNLASMPMPGGP